MDFAYRLSLQSCFLCGDFFANVNGLGIVCDDLTFNSVLKRGHNTTPVGVIFRVGSEDKLDVQRQPQLKSTNLDVPFLQNIE